MVHVLLVDDDESMVDLTADVLGEIHDDWEITTETSASDALATLDGGVDCVVSDYEMPGLDGVEFLQRVRESHPSLPFILFTGKGSEEIAADAISAGVTDYLQKGGGMEQYEILANRIKNVVVGYRAEQDARRGYDAIEAASEGIALLDVDGNITYVNDAFADHYGYDPDELEGRHWEMLHEDREVERFYDEIIPRVQSEGTWVGRTTGKRKDGSTVLEEHTVTLSAAGTTICVVRDISHRQEHKQALTAELDFLNDVLDQLDDVVFVFDEDGTLRWWNDQLNRVTGYSDAELSGKEPTAFVRDRDRDRIDKHVEETLENGFSQIEAELLTEDGTTIPYEFYATEFTDDEETVIGRLSIGRSITQRKEYERRLQRQNDRLSEFAGVLSHDLRNPLNVAMGQLSLLADELPEEHDDRLSRIDGALDRIQRIIEDVLALSKTEAADVNPEPLHLAPIAERAWSGTQQGNAELTVEDLTLQADESLLERLLSNLFRNAIEHGGTDVTIHVGVLSDEAGFYVADDGPGIPEPERGSVFEWEYSTKDGGTGIGLRSVQQICEAHGWEISIEESEAGGARFEISTE